MPVVAPSTHAQPAPGRGLRILIIDDNRDSAGLTALLLEVTGHEVRMAHDGPSGLELARAFGPEVVLLDIGLPGMDGYQVAAALRLEEGLEGVRILAVSGYGEERARLRSREAGCDDHLVKPVDVDNLLNLVARTGVDPAPREGDDWSVTPARDLRPPQVPDRGAGPYSG
jgi:CheY-like chemotaxis protein